MLVLRPYDDLAAHAVLRALDPQDQLEVELVRGAPVSGLALFADWRSITASAAIGLVAFWRSQPFAVIALAPTGQAGVAQGALLARDHGRHRRALGELALAIRGGLPGAAAAHGIRRIEARCWAGHPTAARLLAAVGFAHDCDMAGFGLTGGVIFRQFAWTAPPASPPGNPANPATQKGAAPCA